MAKSSTSFGKGNKAAEGNDKTLRLSTWIEKVLDEEIGEFVAGHTGYSAAMTHKEAMARRIVRDTIQSEDFGEFMDGVTFVADRTEGKPKQSQELTGKDGEPLSVSVVMFKDEE